MATLTPVEHDPFATTPMQGGGKLTPVDHDPFADAAHQQARAYINEHPELQHGFANSMAGKAVQGMTFGWGDELMAGAGAARDWMRGKGDIKELYALHQAMQDEQLKDASKTTGGWELPQRWQVVSSLAWARRKLALLLCVPAKVLWLALALALLRALVMALYLALVWTTKTRLAGL